MDRASLIPTPKECVDFYITESLKDIAESLKKYRESSFDIGPHSSLSYEDAIECGKYIKKICESKGWTVAYTANRSTNQNRWVAMHIYMR